MKFQRFFCLSLVALTSCSIGDIVPFDPVNYTVSTQYKDDFKILKLTDIHWGITANIKEETAYIKEIVKRADPSLIILDGDSFMHANEGIVDAQFDLFDSLQIPWTYTYGNHDLQGLYPSDYINNKLLKIKETSKYLLFANPHDDVYGNANFVIDIKDNDDLIWQIFVLDSNSYHLGKYDVVHEDQIEWFKKMDSVNPLVPALMFYHIPVWEFDTAFDLYMEGKLEGRGVQHESVGAGYTNSGLFEAAKQLGNIKGMFCGHDHINNSDVIYEDIMLSYGIKSGRQVYHDVNMIGGQVITLRRDHVFGFSEINSVLVRYEEVL
jgi:hypothetical protein